LLIVTGTVLYSTKSSKGEGRDLAGLSLRDCLVIGIAQSLALLPGISRSGITIAAGLFCGLERGLSARFSFLLSVPAILGANLLQAYKARETLQAVDSWPFVIGGLTALLAGYGALRLLLSIVQKGRLFRFAYYCWAAGALLAAIACIGPNGS
jgi:undecaprenyl-diphosphatase